MGTRFARCRDLTGLLRYAPQPKRAFNINRGAAQNGFTICLRQALFMTPPSIVHNSAKHCSLEESLLFINYVAIIN